MRLFLKGLTLFLDVDGNLTIGKNIIGSPVAADPHVQGGSLIDGYDGFYADDPTKGFHMGVGYLGGFGGGKVQVKVQAWAQREQAELPEGAVPTPEKVEVDHPDQLVFATAVVDLIF